MTGRHKKPPRLYMDAKRGRWVIRYENWMRRTPFGPEQESEAQALLDKVLGAKSWAHEVRSLKPKVRKPGLTPWARAKTKGQIYFISVHGNPFYPFKIGFCAGSMEKRLSELQIGSPYRLVVLATVPGTYADEQTLHTRLADARMGGEWFRRAPKVLGALKAAVTGTLLEWIEASVPVAFCSEPVQTAEIM